MFSSPAVCRFRNTRTQCLLERAENHETLVGIVGFRAGMKHKRFTIYCTQQHRMATCQPHTHLRNRILFDTSLAVLFAYYAFTPLPVLFQMYASSVDPSPSSCSDSPQYHLQGSFSITLLEASQRFFWKSKVWLRSAD